MVRNHEADELISSGSFGVLNGIRPPFFMAMLSRKIWDKPTGMICEENHELHMKCMWVAGATEVIRVINPY
jgi:hypothetical protein